MNTEHENFLAKIDLLGTLTGADVVKCIEFARQAMLSGECSVEAYYFAKKVLLTQVEVASELVN